MLYDTNLIVTPFQTLHVQEVQKQIQDNWFMRDDENEEVFLALFIKMLFVRLSNENISIIRLKRLINFKYVCKTQ